MIPHRWYAILESHEIRRRPVAVTRLGERLVLWRDASGAPACVAERCPHRGAALGLGRVEEGCVTCPFHALRFDATGRCTLVPASGRGAAVPASLRVRRFVVREAHGFVWLWWGEEREVLPPIPFFDDIDATFSWSTLRRTWAVHYSRAIENQLDVPHVPFVHRTTIGRGGRTVIEGPPARLAGDRLEIWPVLRHDDGVPARKPAEVPVPDRPAMLSLLFPNLWQNRITDDLRIVVAFAPVDEAHTVMYVRYCQRMVRVPVLRELFNLAGRISNAVILRQDQAVVESQVPVRSDLRMDEKLIPGDYPIGLYRRHRQQLLDQARVSVNG
jgi:phenylpropionate dioxygenase-like ring-hydroxylating dioxygenase large terminal subunit